MDGQTSDHCLTLSAIDSDAVSYTSFKFSFSRLVSHEVYSLYTLEEKKWHFLASIASEED